MIVLRIVIDNDQNSFRPLINLNIKFKVAHVYVYVHTRMYVHKWMAENNLT